MHVIVVGGPDLGRRFAVKNGQALVIGRGAETGTRLCDPHVSRRHCKVEFDGATATLTDLGSVSGSYVNGQQVATHLLQVGDRVRIGETELCFQFGEALDHDSASTVTVAPVTARAPEREFSSLIGTIVHHYQIDQHLATGTRGAVFLAHRTGSGQKLALKVLWPEMSRKEEDMRRFVRAMKTMQPIRHPNIVRIYNAGITPKFCWIAMEYVEGETMRQVIERIGTAGMLDWQTSFRAAVQIARALDVAHEHKIVHRNITPNNMFWNSSEKTAKLGDLMLAKALEGTFAVQITRQGEIVGDLAFASPERTYGEANADCRSDIYSLGATVYALLTGRLPFEDKAPSNLILKIRRGELVRPKKYQLSVPDLFEDVVMHMLAPRPEDRFQTPAALLKDLERVGKYEGIDLKP